jgi:SpoVK/Ycf46/Vps4 family AAA+-type ATPase
MVLDRAYLRRFDYVLEVSIPPRSIRAKILDRYLGDLTVSPAWKAMAAEHDGLTPAAVERAAKVTRTVMEAQPGLDADLVVGRVVENGLAALGGPRRSSTAPPATTTYRLEVLNTDRDLVAICAGLKRTGAGRLCLYGPPGTGKTGFGHHLAEVLDRPLLLKRASDLQSKWLGETEQNMARMFAEAAADNAVLLLDEADSFLQDRRGAERSWEVSQVNEMLTQMESFAGIFIASTNLMGKLDQAALRRFELKVKFGYLGRDQILAMYRDSLGLLALPPNPAAEGYVVGLTNLTPGDFAAALRQARLSGARTNTVCTNISSPNLVL